MFLTGLDKHWMIRGIPPQLVITAAFSGSSQERSKIYIYIYIYITPCSCTKHTPIHYFKTWETPCLFKQNPCMFRVTQGSTIHLDHRAYQHKSCRSLQPQIQQVFHLVLLCSLGKVPKHWAVKIRKKKKLHAK